MIGSRRQVPELKQRAIDSLMLSIELFNRPFERGRPEGVLIFLHHAFEMLMKAIIKQNTGIVHNRGRLEPYDFERCLCILHNSEALLNADERATLATLNAHRDAAYHYYQDISEELLYLEAQAGVALFGALLERAFRERLSNHIPWRVLSAPMHPPKDLKSLIDAELRGVDELLEEGTRKGAQAAAKLRPILALATATRDETDRITEAELRRAIYKRRRGGDWNSILPDIAQLKFGTRGQGHGIPLFFDN